jgi:hypothetical protein
VRLRGGEPEILATSILEEARLPARLFAHLYRWSVEESYIRARRRPAACRSPLRRTHAGLSGLRLRSLSAMKHNLVRLLIGSSHDRGDLLKCLIQQLSIAPSTRFAQTAAFHDPIQGNSNPGAICRTRGRLKLTALGWTLSVQRERA